MVARGRSNAQAEVAQASDAVSAVGNYAAVGGCAGSTLDYQRITCPLVKRWPQSPAFSALAIQRGD